jgi:hypothetical protein
MKIAFECSAFGAEPANGGLLILKVRYFSPYVTHVFKDTPGIQEGI